MSDYEKQLTWDKEVGKFVPVEPAQRFRTSKANWWDKSYYGPSLEIPSHTRNALLAVIAIIRNLNKGKPFALGNVTMGECGFRSRDKIRALKELEATGFVKVEWRKKKSPLVTVLKHF
jgi:hypothetical protein